MTDKTLEAVFNEYGTPDREREAIRAALQRETAAKDAEIAGLLKALGRIGVYPPESEGEEWQIDNEMGPEPHGDTASEAVAEIQRRDEANYEYALERAELAEAEVAQMHQDAERLDRLALILFNPADGTIGDVILGGSGVDVLVTVGRGALDGHPEVSRPTLREALDALFAVRQEAQE